MLNNANKALGYTEVYYNYRSEKFFTDAVGNQFQELDITFGGGSGGNSGVSSIVAGDRISINQPAGDVTISADIESSTLDDVTSRGHVTTNDITIGRLTSSKIGLPIVSTLPTTNNNFGDLCALTTDNRPYFYDGSDWRKLYLTDVPSEPGDPDVDWDTVLIRSTFDTNLDDLSDYDHSTGHNNAIRVGSPKKYGAGAVKLEQGVLVYDGVNSFLDSAFTIEFWMYLDNYSYNSVQTSVFLLENGSNRFEYIVDDPNSGAVDFRLRPGEADNPLSFAGEITISTKTWHYITFTRSANTGLVSMYLNGNLQGTVSGNDIAASPGESVLIGDQSDGDFFIDDLRVSTIERYTSNFVPPTAELPTS